MTDAAVLEQLLRRVVRDELRAALADLRDPLAPEQLDLLDALHAVAAGSAFTSREAVEWASRPFGARHRLADALAALGVAGDAKALGQALRSMAGRSDRRGRRLLPAGAESGSRLWRFEQAGT